MDSNFWKKKWEDKKIAFHQTSFNPELVKFWNQSIRSKTGKVFVPLCGKSLDMLYFLEENRSVVGIELSSIAVEEFFAENKIAFEKEVPLYRSEKINIYCQNFFDLTKSDVEGVTAIYDRASLIALPEEMRRKYAQKLGDLFQSGVEYLLLANEFDVIDVGPPFSVSTAMIEDYFSENWIIEQIFENEKAPHEIDVHPGIVSKKTNRGYYLKRK